MSGLQITEVPLYLVMHLIFYSFLFLCITDSFNLMDLSGFRYTGQYYNISLATCGCSHTESTLTAGNSMEHTPIVTDIIQILAIILLLQLMHILCQVHAYLIISLEFLVRYNTCGCVSYICAITGRFVRH